MPSRNQENVDSIDARPSTSAMRNISDDAIDTVGTHVEDPDAENPNPTDIDNVVHQSPHSSDRDDMASPEPTPARLRSRPGTGKGGKRYNIVRNQFKKVKYTAEEKKIQKEKWKKYVGFVQQETEKILSEDLASSHICCPDCSKLITRRNLVRHRTVQGCGALAPEVRLGFWIPK